MTGKIALAVTPASPMCRPPNLRQIPSDQPLAETAELFHRTAGPVCDRSGRRELGQYLALIAQGRIHEAAEFCVPGALRRLAKLSHHLRRKATHMSNTILFRHPP
jgi:hypothetical protein